VGSNRWALGTLASNAAVEITVNGTVRPAARDGTLLRNRVRAEADNADPTADDEVTKVGAGALVDVTKAVERSPVLAGDELVYRIVVRNLSALVPAANVSVVEQYDPIFGFISSAPAPVPGSSNVWSLGTLAPLAQVTILVTGRVSVAAQADERLFNTAEVVSDDGSRTAHATATAYQPALIGGLMWEDFDDNFLYDGELPGVVVGLPVALYSNNVLVATTNLDAAGRYEFGGLWPGAYSVRFTLPSNHVYVLPDWGPDDTVDSDADPLNGQTAVTVLSPGEQDRSVYAGVIALGAIGNFVWIDTSEDGSYTNEDLAVQGLNGVTVRLFRVDSNRVTGAVTTNLVGTTVTATLDEGGGVLKKGFYQFAPLPFGHYTVEVGAGVPAGLTRRTTPSLYDVLLGYQTIFNTANFGFMYPPTAVELRDFGAQRTEGGVRLNWATAVERENLGFRLYRSAQPDGEPVCLTPALIPGVGSSVGRAYEWTDLSAPVDATLWYWLEDVSRSFEAKRHGPVRVEPLGAGPAPDRWLGRFDTPAQGGLCRLTYEALRDSGVDRWALAADTVKVLVDGREVPAYVCAAGGTLGEGDFVLFYAPASSNGLSCAVGSGAGARRMETVYARPSRLAGDVWAGLAEDGQALAFDALPGYVRYLLMDFAGEPVWVADVTDPAVPRLLYGYVYLAGAEGRVGVYLSVPGTEVSRRILAVYEEAVLSVPAVWKE
jgi:hypothetical protein